MLAKYLESLKRLSELLSNGKNMDIQLWKETMSLTAYILIQSIGFLIVLAIIVAGPIILYRYLRNKINTAMEKVTTSSDAQKVAHKWLIIKVAYFICLIVFYVPFMIPTVLLFL